MKSIASGEWEAASHRPAVQSLVTIDAHGSERVVEAASSIDDPEETALVREHLKEVEAAFEDDEEALMILLGDKEGMSPAEIQELTGLDATGYATTRRRIRRRLATVFPKGRAG